jgi:GGDEF domain-containing protein
MSNQGSISVVIADSSRLGSVMLERLLAPLLEVVTCTDSAGLDLALRREPALLMIANQWSGLEALLPGLSDRLPQLGIVLMASPDSDAARIASLSERFSTGVIYRPYEARQVMREIFRLISRHTGSDRDDVPLVTDSSPDPLETLQRDQAFCRRHHLPHSLLALRIDEYASLGEQLGETALATAERSLMAMVTGSLRREDHLCDQRPGRLVLSLPGTPAQGARVLAHRLCQQAQETDIRAGDLTTHLMLLAGIHVVTGADTDALEQDIAVAISTSELANGEASLQVLLSDAACDQLGSAAPPLLQDDEQAVAPLISEAYDEASWEKIATILNQQDLSDSQGAIKALSVVLRQLDESTRMTLVDELLLASAMPE